MKRVIVYAAMVVFILSLAGCSNKDKKTEETTAAFTEATTEATTEAKTEATTEATEEQTKTDYEEVYSDVIHHIYDLLVSDADELEDVSDEDVGIYEVKMAGDISYALQNVGYTLMDISQDGVPELIIADAGGSILAIYTCDGQTPEYVVSGKTRSYKRLLKDGKTIYEQSSGGAALYLFGKFHLSENGKKIEWEECYFTYPDDAFNMHYYYNTTGLWEPDKAEELNITDEEFYAKDNLTEDSYMLDLGLTMFADMPGGTYNVSGGAVNGSEQATGTGVEVMPAENCRMRLSNATVIDISDGENWSEIAFLPVDGSVTDIYFYEIEYSDSSENNQWFKEVRELSYIPVIKEDEPLVAKISFPGDIPTTGFSFVDATGTVWRYTICLSGFDGSVQINPYFPAE